jgi:acetate kinase
MRVLTVNAGSTSLKFERYEINSPLAPIGQPPDPSFRADSTIDEAEYALAQATREPIDLAVHRFVQLPADAPAVLQLDAGMVARIARAGADDPLHEVAGLRVVDIVKRVLPTIPQFAVSDSFFHRTMSEPASTYALPREVTGTTFHRIGYHGLSHEYAAHRGCAIAGLDVRNCRVVTAHLGGGSSLCALRNGESIDTTMGYTSLEGLPMATRSGSVDPGLLLHFLRAGMTPDDLQDMLLHRSGLLGISGISGDVRDLLAATGNAAARLALDVLAWRLRAALGSSIAVLGGTDLIVFTGGIGEHAPSIRAAALEHGLGLGVTIDADLNVSVSEGRIDCGGNVAVAVVSAREGWQLARAVMPFAPRLD